MGATQAGALNTRGFQSAVTKGIIPTVDHITYSGAFNQQYFRVGLRTQRQLDLAIGVSVCNTPIDSGFLGTKNQFLSLFLKSCKDGRPRTQPIHAVLVLDISASMKELLNQRSAKQKTRLKLAREGIKLFYKKLTPDDYFGLVLFEDRAKTIIPSKPVGQMNESWVFDQIEAEVELGGTNLRAGLTEAERHFSKMEYKAKLPYERRIVMLTDVNDNSMAAQDQFVNQLVASKIHCTIVGISDEFKSESCEKLAKTKGFNYFCATQDSDLKTHLSDHFDFTFFPVASKIKIWLESRNVQGIDVYGTPDSNSISTFGTPIAQNTMRYFITEMNSGFPSEYKFDDQGKQVTKGGLIIVKMIPCNPLQKNFECRLILQYERLDGEKQQQFYDVKHQLELDQFHSSETAEKASRIFYYAYCLRSVLGRMNSDSRRLTFHNRRTYIRNLQYVREITPEDKKKDVDRLIELVERFPPD